MAAHCMRRPHETCDRYEIYPALKPLQSERNLAHSHSVRNLFSE